MGSKFSKAVRPHVKPDAAAAPATSDNHDINAATSRQDSISVLPVCSSKERSPTLPCRLSHDDINLTTSTPRIMSALRRNSEPSRSPPQNAGAESRLRQNRLDDFEQFLVERQMMAIDMEEPTPVISPAPPSPPVQSTPPVPQCLFCCKDLPKDGTEVVLTPCRHCQSPCCTSCIKNMFVEACRDATRMPPRCCAPINLHIAKPYLSEEETALFRVKYEEWCTPKPVYCPVPTCSAFIPDRLLPPSFKKKSEARVDSGIGTPTPELFTCPTCEAGICVGCKEQAHPESMCSAEEFGIDADTAALLKAWGYKRCPKCGNGVKRMFGCNHMECRCGANFCWVCLNNINECDGGCRDDDDDEEDYESESEPNDDQDTATPNNAASDQSASVAADENATAGADQSETSPQPARHVTNLDGGGARHWAESSFDFGEEPSDDGSTAIWSCHHSFMPYTVLFKTALAPHTGDMECVKCWKTIHPSIENKQSSVKTKTKLSPRASANGVRRRQTAIRGRPLRGRGAYVPPRGLQRADATIGTAPHLSAVMHVQPLAIPRTRLSRLLYPPMEGVQFSERDANVDGHSSITPPTSSQTSQLASHNSFTSRPQSPRRYTKKSQTSVFANPPPPSSLAHECRYCYALVCQSCKDDIVAEEEAKQKQDDVVTVSEQISGGPEQRAEVVTTEQGVANATAVEAVLEEEEDEDEDMHYSLFD